MCATTSTTSSERFGADLIAEVAHPDMSAKYGARFAAAADYFVGSPTAFASADVEVALRRGAAAAMPNGFGVYIPGGECACPNPGA